MRNQRKYRDKGQLRRRASEKLMRLDAPIVQYKRVASPRGGAKYLSGDHSLSEQRNGRETEPRLVDTTLESDGLVAV